MSNTLFEKIGYYSFTALNYWRSITITLFDYMNGYVNHLNYKCRLFVEDREYLSRVNGVTAFPSDVTIFLGNILNMCYSIDYPEFKDSTVRHNMIGTMIAWTVCHELLHADQKIDVLRYGNDPQYNNLIESAVEAASYDWVLYHAMEIEDAVQHCFKVVIDSFQRPVELFTYERATPQEFYMQTILNIVMRDPDAYNSIKELRPENECKYANIELVFKYNDHSDSSVIKSAGRYQDGVSIERFTSAVTNYVALYDIYHISYFADEIFNQSENTLILYFVIQDRSMYPITFDPNNW